MVTLRRLRLAVQSSGRLREPSLDFARSLGLEFDARGSRGLVMACANADVELVFVRHGDIPEYVRRGVVDFAVVGRNVLEERGVNLPIVRELEFGECRLVVAVPENSAITSVADLDGERIATSYPRTLKTFLQRNGLAASVIEISGSVEAAPLLGLADAICDLTQTGSTMRANGLREVAGLLNSRAVLVESPFGDERKAAFARRFMEVLA